MARIKIELPASFHFSVSIAVRITDINYGGHVGNDSILSLIHEARMMFLHGMGYSETELEGAGLIMADVGIEFKSELFYGDQVIVSVVCSDFSKAGFDMYYKLEKDTPDGRKPVALAKTGMVCFDYAKKKISMLPQQARQKLESQYVDR